MIPLKPDPKEDEFLQSKQEHAAHVRAELEKERERKATEQIAREHAGSSHAIAHAHHMAGKEQMLRRRRTEGVDALKQEAEKIMAGNPGMSMHKAYSIAATRLEIHT